MDASQEQVPGPLPELGGQPYGAGDAFRDALAMLESAGGAYVGAAHRLAGLDAARRIVREPSLNGTGELAFTDRPTFTTLFREARGTFEPKIHLSDDVYPYLPGFELKRSPTPQQRAQNAVLLAGILFHELDHLERPPGRHVVNPRVIERPAWEQEIGFYQDLFRVHRGTPLQGLIQGVASSREAEGRQHGYVVGDPRFATR